MPRPVSTLVFGVLNLVFGALGLLSLVMTVAILFMPQPKMAHPNPILATNPGECGLRVVHENIRGLGSVGQRGPCFGRRGTIMAEAVGTPSLDRLRDIRPPRGRRRYGGQLVLPHAVGGEGVSNAGRSGASGPWWAGPSAAWSAVAWACIYPAILLFFMFRPNVVAAMQPSRWRIVESTLWLGSQGKKRRIPIGGGTFHVVAELWNIDLYVSIRSRHNENMEAGSPWDEP